MLTKMYPKFLRELRFELTISTSPLDHSAVDRVSPAEQMTRHFTRSSSHRSGMRIVRGSPLPMTQRDCLLRCAACFCNTAARWGTTIFIRVVPAHSARHPLQSWVPDTPCYFSYSVFRVQQQASILRNQPKVGVVERYITTVGADTFAGKRYGALRKHMREGSTPTSRLFGSIVLSQLVAPPPPPPPSSSV